MAYFGEWAANMSVALAPSMAPSSPNGVFSPACYIHCDFSAASPLLQGLNYIDAFTGWYFGDAGAKTKLRDDCGILCNPTCAHCALGCDQMRMSHPDIPNVMRTLHNLGSL